MRRVLLTVVALLSRSEPPAILKPRPAPSSLCRTTTWMAASCCRKRETVITAVCLFVTRLITTKHCSRSQRVYRFHYIWALYETSCSVCSNSISEWRSSDMCAYNVWVIITHVWQFICFWLEYATSIILNIIKLNIWMLCYDVVCLRVRDVYTHTYMCPQWCFLPSGSLRPDLWLPGSSSVFPERGSLRWRSGPKWALPRHHKPPPRAQLCTSSVWPSCV